MSTNELMNPATLSMMRSRRGKLMVRIGVICAVVVGAMAGGFHYEEPFLPHWLGLCPPEIPFYRCENPTILNYSFGLVCGLILLGYFAGLHRFVKVRPVITCRSCKSVGWIFDLEPDGVCPRCGARRFDARIRQAGVAPGGMMPWLGASLHEDVDGDVLLARKRAKELGYE